MKKTENMMRSMLIEQGAPAIAVARLMDALDAETPQGKEDHRARIQAAVAVLHQVDGKPVERRHEIRETRSGAPSLPELMSSPAAREALRLELRRHPEVMAALREVEA